MHACSLPFLQAHRGAQAVGAAGSQLEGVPGWGHRRPKGALVKSGRASCTLSLAHCMPLVPWVHCYLASPPVQPAGTPDMWDDHPQDLSSMGQWPGSSAAALAPPAANQAIDLAALAAPLLLQRSPAARSLYWKVLLAPPPILHASSRLWGPEQQRLQHLHGWLALQLQRGRLVPAASGSAYVEGPLPLRIGDGTAAEVVAELATCLASPDSSTQHCGTAALAGASGIVMALPAARSGHREVQQRLPLPSSMAARLPVLLVAGTDAAAQHWQQEIAACRLPLTGPVKVISVEEGAAAQQLSAAAAASSSTWQAAAEPAAYSRQRLVAGLRWLAAHSPPQPVLKVSRWATCLLIASMLEALCSKASPCPHAPAGCCCRSGGP